MAPYQPPRKEPDQRVGPPEPAQVPLLWPDPSPSRSARNTKPSQKIASPLSSAQRGSGHSPAQDSVLRYRPAPKPPPGPRLRACAGAEARPLQGVLRSVNSMKPVAMRFSAPQVSYLACCWTGAPSGREGRLRLRPPCADPAQCHRSPKPGGQMRHQLPCLRHRSIRGPVFCLRSNHRHAANHAHSPDATALFRNDMAQTDSGIPDGQKIV